MCVHMYVIYLCARKGGWCMRVNDCVCAVLLTSEFLLCRGILLEFRAVVVGRTTWVMNREVCVRLNVCVCVLSQMADLQCEHCNVSGVTCTMCNIIFLSCIARPVFSVFYFVPFL